MRYRSSISEGAGVEGVHWEERGVQGHGVEHSSSVSIFVSLRLKTLVSVSAPSAYYNYITESYHLDHFCIHVQKNHFQGCVDISFVNAVLC